MMIELNEQMKGLTPSRLAVINTIRALSFQHGDGVHRGLVVLQAPLGPPSFPSHVTVCFKKIIIFENNNL
jgi:hypothetical protein